MVEPGTFFFNLRILPYPLTLFFLKTPRFLDFETFFYFRLKQPSEDASIPNDHKRETLSCVISNLSELHNCARNMIVYSPLMPFQLIMYRMIDAKQHDHLICEKTFTARMLKKGKENCVKTFTARTHLNGFRIILGLVPPNPQNGQKFVQLISSTHSTTLKRF